MQNVPSTDLGTSGKIEFAGLSRFSAVSMSSTLFSSLLNDCNAGLGQQSESASAGLDATWQGLMPRVDEAAVQTASAASATVASSATRTASETARTSRSSETATRSTEKRESKNDDDDEDEADIEDMKDVAVDPDVLSALMPKLKQYGLSDEDAATLTQRAKSEQGITWGQLVNFVADKTGSSLSGLTLDDGQQQHFLTLFQKAGFSSSDAEKLLTQLQGGDVNGVVSSLRKQLASQTSDTSSLTGTEIQDLASELGQLKGRSDAQSVGLARSIADSMHTAMQKIRAQLLGQGMTQAQVDATQTVNTSVAGAAQYDPTSKVVDRSTALAHAGKAIETLSTGEQASVVNDRIQDAAAQQLSMSGDRTADQFMQQDDATRQQNAKSDQAWNEFTARLRQDVSSGGERATSEIMDQLLGTTEAVGQTQTTSGRTTAQQTQAQTAAWRNTNAPRLLSQVQDGLYRTLNSGQKQLTLHLNPAELGQMTLIVKSSGKEVSATIRADHPEAARVIAEHLDQVRQALESEGLKVAKLEVQTQLTGQEGSSQWQGETEHNQARDEEEMARNRSRWRVLRGESGTTVAEDAATTSTTSVDSGQGLHLIA